MATLITIVVFFLGGIIPPQQVIGAGIEAAIEACGSPEKVVSVEFTCNVAEKNCDVFTMCASDE